MVNINSNIVKKDYGKMLIWEPMDPRHDVVKAEKEDFAVAQCQEFGRARVVAVADMIAPFYIFIYEKGRAQDDGGRLQEYGAALCAVFDGRYRKGHGQAAGEQDDGIDGP